MNELSDEEVFGRQSGELSDDQVFGSQQQSQQPQQEKIPQAFIDRWRQGRDLQDVINKRVGGKEKDIPGIDTPGYEGALAVAGSLLNQMIVHPLITATETFAKASQGESVFDDPDWLSKGFEIGGLGMFRGTQWSRVTAQGVQRIGEIPKAQDFQTAAQVLAPDGGFTAFHGSPNEFGQFKGTSVDVSTDRGLAEGYRQPRGAPAQFGKARSSGFLYQVEVGAKQEDFLNLDRPLTAQSEQVKVALDKAGITIDDRSGADVWDALRDANGAENVARAMREAGIAGTSREHGVYSVFDPNILSITHKNGAAIAEENLRDLWEERGIHPAEAVHDADRDAFLKADLTYPNPEPRDRSGIPRVTGSPVAEGTPRTELAKTGEAHIDAVLDSAVTNRNIDNPVINDSYDVPYSAGGSTPLEDPTVFIDRHFPRSMTIDGVTFDPADPFTIHENVEQHVMDLLIRGGMDEATAYKVAHHEWAEKAEGAWYKAHGIDQAKAEEAYQPFIDQIEHENPANPPPNLYTKPYPHQDVRSAKNETGPVPEPTAEEIARAKEIVARATESDEMEPALAGADAGAAVTPPHLLPPLSVQPPPRAGSLVAAIKDAGAKLFDVGRNIQMLTTPMVRGSKEAQAIAKDFANTMRRNRWEWQRIDQNVVNDPGLKAARARTGETAAEQRERMWNAADEESTALQTGTSTAHQGLATLEPEERAVVQDLQLRSQLAWAHARNLDMVEGDGLPAYTPRMIYNVATAGGDQRALPLNSIGLNLRTRTAQMLHREYMYPWETEAAAKARLGPEAVLARDIRALPLATAKLEDAIAGRTLINAIEDAGKNTGSLTVSVGSKPDKEWFTIDHPAFKRWTPDLEQNPITGKWAARTDDAGNVIFKQVPIYIRGDFEGPLRSVLTVPSGAAYGALMALKGKTMGLIMNSPLIHNAVEWGRALPAMPGKVATFRVYFDGNHAKSNPVVMHEAIEAGLVPIGKRFFNQDITSIMEEPNLAPGRSWTAQVLGFIPDLFDQAAGDAVKSAIDKAGDFWHNTLLWDRVGNLQMGLYTNFRDGLMAKGVDRLTASRAAAHWANRYAGALPQEAMSDSARKISNLLLFSRSFTLGNIGAMKDMLTGLPKDVMAQIERDGGMLDPKAVRSIAVRKAIAIVTLDMGLMYVGNSLLQNSMNVLTQDSTLDKEMHGYAERFKGELEAVKEHPLKLLQPLSVIQSLSATAENEPGRDERIRVGYASDGTAIYARNPAGKIGEEFTGYLTGPLDMIHKKLGTIARPVWQIMANDAGFGRKVYDPNADAPAKYLGNMGAIAKHLAMSQLPEGQIGAFMDLVKGDGDPKVNALQAFGPVAGVTFSKGAPGGPAVGELYQARAMHDYAVQAQLPDIRKQIQRGDVEGARDRMMELGIPPGLQRFYIRTSQDPATRLNGRTLRDFYLYGTPEQKQRLENAR